MHKWGNPIANNPPPPQSNLFKELLLVSAGVTWPAMTLHGKEWTLLRWSLVFLNTTAPTPRLGVLTYEMWRNSKQRENFKMQRKWLISWNESWFRLNSVTFFNYAAFTYKGMRIFFLS